MRVVTAEQMRELDRRTIEERGVPSIRLMERAGREVAAAVDARLADRPGGAPVVVLCGRGNNGGDGWVVARLLHARGTCDVTAFLMGRFSDVDGDAREMLDEARRAGVPIVEVENDPAWTAAARRLTGAGLIIDALVGTGLNRPLGGLLARVVADANAAQAPVVSVDVPSGLLESPPGGAARRGSDCGTVNDDAVPAVHATLTVTFAAPKLALLQHPEHTGNLSVADIGIPADLIDALDGPRIELLTPVSLRRCVPIRRLDTHKGECGRVLIVAGSRGKTGAAQLAGLGALRAGAGLVTVATPESCLEIVARVPEYMTHPLPDCDGAVTGSGLDVLLAAPADVVAAGPGLGTGEGAGRLIHALLDRQTAPPLVLDADALNVCATAPQRLRGNRNAEVVITPHPGEMARLVGTTTAAVQSDRIGIARTFAQAHDVHVVLKGARTVIAAPDGTVQVNATGNSGMATGGSGDVLTGAIAGWIGQVPRLTDAIALAVHVHGRAGDLAAQEMGATGLIAGDIATRLGRAAVALTREGLAEGA